MSFPELTALLARNLDVFLLVFVRLGAMLAWTPVLGHRSVPLPHRAGLTLLLAWIVTPTLPAMRAVDRDALGWTVAIIGEALVGLLIAFVAQLVLAAVEMAGELIGFEMGLSMGAVFDPARGEQETIIGRFFNTFAVLVFLTVNGHHLLIRAVAVSFDRLPPGSVLDLAAAGGVVSLGAKLVQSGCALAAPLLGVLLIINVALALVGRVAPQANVFVLGLPLSIGIGVLGLYEVLPSFTHGVALLVAEIPGDLDGVLLGASHGLR
jgi:flagellar biosynthetic protein FliR